MLTFYSTKNLTPEKTEKDDPDTMKLKVIKHRKIFWKIRKLKLNSPEGQDKDFVIDDRNVVISLNPQSVSQTSDMYAIRQETVEQPLNKKKKGNDETRKFN